MLLSWRDRLLLGGLRALPAPLARHLMFLMHSRPAAADALGYHVWPAPVTQAAAGSAPATFWMARVG